MRIVAAIAALLVLGLFIAGPAAADESEKGSGEKQRPSREELLKKFDLNGDGKLDDEERAKMREEFQKRFGDRKPGEGRGERKRGEGRPSREELIKKFDANGDGVLDESEKAKMREELQKRFGERKPGEARGQRKPGERKPGEARGERKPGERKPGEARGQRKPGERKPGEARGERKPGERKPGEARGQRKPGERKPKE